VPRGGYLNATLTSLLDLPLEELKSIRILISNTEVEDPLGYEQEIRDVMSFWPWLVEDGTLVQIPYMTVDEAMERKKLLTEKLPIVDKWGYRNREFLRWYAGMTWDAVRLMKWATALDRALIYLADPPMEMIAGEAQDEAERVLFTHAPEQAHDRFFLFFEDDMYAAKGYVAAIRRFREQYFTDPARLAGHARHSALDAMDAAHDSIDADWFALLFYTPLGKVSNRARISGADVLASVGAMLRMDDIPYLTEFVQAEEFYSPLNVALGEYIDQVLAKAKKGKKSHKAGKVESPSSLPMLGPVGRRTDAFVRLPTLFEHGGRQSTVSVGGTISLAGWFQDSALDLPAPEQYQLIWSGESAGVPVGGAREPDNQDV